MKRLSFAALLLVTACATTNQQSSFKQELEQAHQHSMTVLNAISKPGQLDCNSPNWQTAATAISALRQGFTNYQNKKLDMIRYPGLYSNSERKDVDALADFWRKESIESSFEAADTALKRGCLDKADIFYRDIINVYTGSSYAAIRQRAQIGIDDVNRRKTR